MLRSFFIGLVIFAMILGLECMVVDQANLRSDTATQQRIPGSPEVAASRKIVPPEWAPWSLLSAGAVTIIYSISLPKRYGIAG